SIVVDADVARRDCCNTQNPQLCFEDGRRGSRVWRQLTLLPRANRLTLADLSGVIVANRSFQASQISEGKPGAPLFALSSRLEIWATRRRRSATMFSRIPWRPFTSEAELRSTGLINSTAPAGPTVRPNRKAGLRPLASRRTQ